MRSLIAILRIVSMLVGSSLLVTAPGAVRLWAALTRQSESPRTMHRLSAITRAWGTMMAFCAGVRIVRPAGPRPLAGVITSNHLTYLDIFVVASTFPCRFIAKREIARWPFLGLLARSVRTIFIERGKRTELIRIGEEIRATEAAGVSVVFFPEGGCSDGSGVRPFHGGLFECAVRAGIRSLPLCVRYRLRDEEKPVSEIVCWADDTPLLSHVWRLLKTGGITAEIQWAEEPVIAADRKSLARVLHEETVSMFAPVR